jgi:triphosphoribosyl-dephospho-CoA synthase
MHKLTLSLTSAINIKMTMKQYTPETIARAYQSACMDELQALKPGNVHIFADGHGMTVHDFIKSADVTAGVMANPAFTLGERIFYAVEATQQALGQNTNLGMLLLCAPLVEAAFKLKQHQTLAQSLHAVLCQTTVSDAYWVAKAIVLANPAGLGNVKHGDVHNEPAFTLLEMMQLAQFKDRIAWNYANAYSDILCFGIDRYRDAMLKWDKPAWATTALYLGMLSAQPDTHILRKFGEISATKVMQEASALELFYWQADNPKLVQKSLLIWDVALKQRGINPGTSADLVVATLFVEHLLKIV